MSKFTLEIKLGNDTMRTPADVLDVIANSIPTDSFTDWSEPENAGVSERCSMTTATQSVTGLCNDHPRSHTRALTAERTELIAQYRRRQIRRAKRREAIKQFARATFWVAVATGGLLAVSISSLGN